MTPKYQQGGPAPQAQGAEDMQQQIVSLVQAAMQGDEQARGQIQQIMEAAQQGDPQATQIAQMVQEVVQAMQGQARKALIGGKLNYIHRLRTGANLDEQVLYEKKGGKLTKKIVRKNQNETEDQPEMKKNKKKKKVYYEEM